jgi:hypothetical protein
MHNRFQSASVALSEELHREAVEHLIRKDYQEDLCFGLWNASFGQERFTALLTELVLPEKHERIVRGNVSFEADYYLRALAAAVAKNCGLALLHSHLGPGWQGLSSPDFTAEANHAGAVLAATGLPFLGMTLGVDGAWSSRHWNRTGPRTYTPMWCESVRVVGDLLGVTFHPTLAPEPQPRERLKRTVGVWGQHGQAQLARLRIGIVGLGSVGSIVCELLVRMGVQRLVLIDFDRVEEVNLDRILNTTEKDLGLLKTEVAWRAAKRSATARVIKLSSVPHSIAEEEGYRSALDCDVLFSCVDRHWPRRILNHIAYAHLIPVIDGGILVSLRGERLIGSDWHVHTVGPGRKCLECWGAFNSSIVGLEHDGMRDDPSYLRQLDPHSALLRHENVIPFSASVGSLEVLQFAALMFGPAPNLGDQNYHSSTGTLDRADDSGCEDHCLYAPLVGSADLKHCPIDRVLISASTRVPF